MIKLKHILNEVISEADVFGNTTATNTDTSSAGSSEEVLDDMFDDFEKDIKQADLDAPEKEGVGFTLAGFALSFGEIQKLLGKFINLISKIPGFKKLSGDKLIQWGENNHHRVMKAFEWPLKKAGVKDAAARKKAAEILHAVVVALLLWKGVGTMADKFAKGSNTMGYLKGALNAVKTEELGVFLKKAFAAI